MAVPVKDCVTARRLRADLAQNDERRLKGYPETLRETRLRPRRPIGLGYPENHLDTRVAVSHSPPMRPVGAGLVPGIPVRPGRLGLAGDIRVSRRWPNHK